MKKIFRQVLIVFLLSSPAVTLGLTVLQADSVIGAADSFVEETSSSDLISTIFSQGIDESFSGAEGNELEEHLNDDESVYNVNDKNAKVLVEDVVVDEQPIVTEKLNAEIEESELMITFKTKEEFSFANGEITIQISKKVGEKLLENEIPTLAQSEKFVGWLLNGEEISNEELILFNLTEDVELIALIKVELTNVADSYLDKSIKEVISEEAHNKIFVIPSPTSEESYATYQPNESGFKQALFDMYQTGGNAEYVIYIGNANLSLSSDIGKKSIPESVSNTNVTFYALKDKVSRLIITGSSEDQITNSVSLGTSSKQLTFPTDVHFGTDIVLRNLDYSGTNIYMNGCSLSLNGGSTGNGFNIYGGAESGDVTGNPTITVNATGTGTWNLYGGNKNGGTLTGNPSIVINNTVGGINTIAGGANIGTINGNTAVSIKQLNGRLTNYYGGGIGTSTSNTANVNGNVTTTIETINTNFKLSGFVGGVNYGDITGSIHSDVSGLGGWYSTTVRFTGGSMHGNIGTDRSKDAITTNLDSSQYTSYKADFEGGNRNSGTITGNIVNYVKAGVSASAGGIGDFDGGGGADIPLLTEADMKSSNLTTYDSYTPEQRAQFAEESAKFKVYGNITSHLISGSFSNGEVYTSTAAGRGGYIEGNTKIIVGTYSESGIIESDKIAYSGPTPTSFDYSTTTKNLGYKSKWYIVGGGGVAGTTWDIYINGNTETIINNAIASRTYGGSASGVIEGNSKITLNAGIVDTLEGAGYLGRRIYGDCQAIVNNGQVDWFLTGGGWGDLKIDGNVGVTVYDGVINASVGASYGGASPHVITGNSDIRIYGGDFSGTSRTGPNGFSGGMTNGGTLQGNASLTLDLRNYDGEFKLPGGTYISGGNRYDSTNVIGTDESNTITLNIYTKLGSDVLKEATIYGDGGQTASNTKSGQIFINIQAEGSSIGNIYATYYQNTSSSTSAILKNVEMKIQGAKSIATLSGGNASDDFTNSIVAKSDKQVNISFGEDIDQTGSFQEDPIKLTGSGVINFTNLSVKNGIKVFADGGNIKNGRSATASSHGNTYSEFGDIHLSKDGGIGVSANNMIVGGKLIVEDDGTIESPPGKGLAIFSDFETPDLTKDSLTWIKTTTDDTKSLISSQAQTFGTVDAYQVLTITPTINNASKITPQNFSGYEKATGKYFIGDNDTSKSDGGYGIAIPGSMIEYEVESPVAEGEGFITHNVTEVKKNNEPLSINAWGTDQAGVQVQKGKLLIPYTVDKLPTLTFTPETEQTGSWLYNTTVTTSDKNSGEITIEEQSDSNPVDWQSPDGQYQYTIKVTYSNKAELTAKNIIIPEQQAANLTKEQVLEVINATGRPFLKDSLTDEELAEIQQSLTKDVYSKHSISLEVGITEENHIEETVNLVVVKDDSTIAENGSFAVYAKSARLTLEEANNILNENDLAKYTAATTIFADNRENQLPTVDQTALETISQTTEEQLANNVSTVYSYQELGQTVSKTVNVMVAGELKLKSTPTSLDFGEQRVSTTVQTYWPTIQDDIIIKDTRGTERSTWRLTVKEAQVLIDGKNVLDNLLSFVKDGEEQFLNDGEIVIEERQLNDNEDYIVNENWGAEQMTGVKLTVPVEKQIVGEYRGTLSWQLADVPGNT